MSARTQIRLLVGNAARGLSLGATIGVVFALAFGLGVELLPYVRGEALPGTVAFLPYLVAGAVVGGGALGGLIGLVCGLASAGLALASDGSRRVTVPGSAAAAAGVGGLIGYTLGSSSLTLSALLALAFAGVAGLLGMRLGRRAALSA